MEQENFNEEVEVAQKHPVFKVTPLSKYLAMILFILMPFIGGWIGYTYAPEKVVEVEKIIIKEIAPPIVSDLPKENPTNVPVEDEVKGVQVSFPTPGSVVKLPLTIEGSISGDGWFANEGEVGNVRVFDSNDKPISNIAILKATTDWLKLPTSFEALVGDREMMSYIETDTGYIKLTNKRGRDDDSALELIIPIRFK